MLILLNGLHVVINTILAVKFFGVYQGGESQRVYVVIEGVFPFFVHNVLLRTI